MVIVWYQILLHDAFRRFHHKICSGGRIVREEVLLITKYYAIRTFALCQACKTHIKTETEVEASLYTQANHERGQPLCVEHRF